VQFPSLLPLLRGEREQLLDSMYCAYRHFQRSVRTETHKLILYPQIKQTQLFDIIKDPWEMENLATDSTHAATVSKLFSMLQELQKTVNDPMTLDPSAFGIRT
jgi:arylsulfatase A-like enzyme